MGYPNKLGHYRDGLYRRSVKEISTATTSVQLYAKDSGMTYFVPTWTTGTIVLPKISSKWLGVEFTFFVEEQATSNDVSINADDYDSSCKIKLPYSSIVDESTGCSLGSTFATGLRLTAVSSIAWMGQPLTANSYSFSSAASDNVGGWVVGV